MNLLILVTATLLGVGSTQSALIKCKKCMGVECEPPDREESCTNEVCFISAVLLHGQTTPEYDYGCLSQFGSKAICNSTTVDHTTGTISHFNCCTNADFCNRELSVSLPSSLIPSTDPTTTNADPTPSASVGNITMSTPTPTTHAPRVNEWEIAMYTAIAVGSIIILVLVSTLLFELIYCRRKILKSRSSTQQLQLSASVGSTQESDSLSDKDHLKIIDV